MKRFFFVTGLPRSRTAWLSCFLHHGDVSCRHEALRQGVSERRLYETLVSTPGAVVGDCDSGLAAVPEVLESRFRNHRIAVVHRDPEEVEHSLRQVYRDADLARSVVDRCQRGIERIETLPEARGFEYEGFDASLESLWHWVLPDRPFPAWRAEELRMLRIEQDAEAVRSILRGTESFQAA